MTTVARKDGGDYLLRGQDLFVSHTDHADFILTFEGLYDAPDHAAIGAFIVDRNAADLLATPIDDVAVLLLHSFVQTYYDNLRVPAARRLGAEGLRAAMCGPYGAHRKMLRGGVASRVRPPTYVVVRCLAVPSVATATK